MQEKTDAAIVPVVLLIGTLLLIWGIIAVVSAPVTMRTALIAPRILEVRPYLLYEEAGSLLLGLAGIVAGVGLLLFAPWARRAAVGYTLFALCFSLVLMVLPYTYSAARTTPFEWWRIPVLLLFRPGAYRLLHFAVVLFFLESLALRTFWEEERRPGPLTEAAERTLRLFPATLTPVALFTACYFCGWIYGDALSGWFSHMFVWPMTVEGFIRQGLPWYLVLTAGYLLSIFALITRRPWAYPVALGTLAVNSLFYLANYVFVWPLTFEGFIRQGLPWYLVLTVGYLLSIFAFITRRRWAFPVALGTLAVNALYFLANYVHPETMNFQLTSGLLSVISLLFNVLTRIAIYAVFAWFLVKEQRRVGNALCGVPGCDDPSVIGEHET